MDNRVLNNFLAILVLTGATTCFATEAVKNKQIIQANATAETTEAEAPIPDEPSKVDQKDPLEGFNRAMFTFNDKLDTYFLKPIATLYNKVMPVPLNKGIHNFFENINTIPTIANDILQANFYQASNDTWRLGLNSTVGIGGLFDIAERIDLAQYSTDFGLTLSKWGYTNSTYLVLPFFGPNTIRDGLIGLPVDYFAFSLYPYIDPPSLRYQLYGLGVIDRRAQLLKFQDVLEEATYDKYVFAKNAYLQRRAYLIDDVNHRSCKDRWVAKTADAKTAEVTSSDNESVLPDLNAEPVVTPKPASDENYD